MIQKKGHILKKNYCKNIAQINDSNQLEKQLFQSNFIETKDAKKMKNFNKNQQQCEIIKQIGKIVKNTRDQTHQLKGQQIEQSNSSKEISDNKLKNSNSGLPKTLQESLKFTNLFNLDSGKGKIIKVGKGKTYQDFKKHIKIQIKYDQQLRTLNHQIKANQKLKIREILAKQYQIHHDIISLDSLEYDPFFSYQESINTENLTRKIVFSYQLEERYWTENFKNCYDGKILQSIFSEFEGQNTNQAVSIQTFVRGLNTILKSEKYLRKRDLYRLYKRLSPLTKETFCSYLRWSNEYIFTSQFFTNNNNKIIMVDAVFNSY